MSKYIAANDLWFISEDWDINLLEHNSLELVEILDLTLQHGYKINTSINESSNDRYEANPLHSIIGAIIYNSHYLDKEELLELCDLIDDLPNFENKYHIIYGLIKTCNNDNKQFLYENYNFWKDGRRLYIGVSRELLPLNEAMDILTQSKYDILKSEIGIEELVQFTESAINFSFDNISKLALVMNRVLGSKYEKVISDRMTYLLRYLRQHSYYNFIGTIKRVNFDKMLELSGEPVEGLLIAADINYKIDRKVPL